MRLFIDIETAPQTNVFKGEYKGNAEFIVMDKILRKTGASPLVNDPIKAKFFNQMRDWKSEERALSEDPVFEDESSEESLPEHAVYNNDFYSVFSLNPEYGRVACISVGYYSLSKHQNFIASSIKCFHGGEEKDILTNFNNFLEEQKITSIVAHNGKKFDFPFISKRMIINGMSLPSILDTSNKKPWEIVSLIDTMEMWSMGVFNVNVSLEDLCYAFDIASPKNALHGSLVPQAFYDGRIQEIASYCNGDVLALMKVYHKMTAIKNGWSINTPWIAPKETFV